MSAQGRNCLAAAFACPKGDNQIKLPGFTMLIFLNDSSLTGECSDFGVSISKQLSHPLSKSSADQKLIEEFGEDVINKVLEHINNNIINNTFDQIYPQRESDHPMFSLPDIAAIIESERQKSIQELKESVNKMVNGSGLSEIGRKLDQWLQSTKPYKPIYKFAFAA